MVGTFNDGESGSSVRTKLNDLIAALAGGDTGQRLEKSAAGDHAFIWATPSAGGDGSANYIDLKADFSATGDGVADDGPAFDSALTSIMSSGRTLFVPAGTYLLTPWTPPEHTGPIRIVMERGAVIRVPGTTQFLASAPSTFHEFNIEGGELDMDGGGRIAEWRGQSGTGSVPLFRLQGVTIRNVVNTGAPTEASAKSFDAWDSGESRVLIDEIQVHECRFIGGTIGIEFFGVDGGAITNNVFEQITYLGVSINRASFGEFGGKITFSGNVFKDIVNSSSGADTHGLMLFGKGFVIDGNHFGFLRGANANGNAEGFYSKGHDIVISNNTFEDAGAQRGMISLKGQKFGDPAPSQNHPEGFAIVVTGNTFRFTDDFVTNGPPNGVALHIELTQVLVESNYFYNIALWKTVTVGSEAQIAGGLIALLNNHFLDCGAGADSQVVNLSALGSEIRIVYRGNVHTYDERVGGRLLYIENADDATATIEQNYFEDAGTAAIWLRSTGSVHLEKAIVRDNTFRDCAKGLDISGGTLPLLIHRNNRNIGTGALQQSITSTVTTEIDENAGAGGGGATTLDELNDVTLTGPANNEVLTFDSGAGQWVNQAPAGGGTGTVDTSGTPVAGELAKFVDADTIEGFDVVSTDANNTLTTAPKFWVGTQAEYDALTPDPNTLYFTTD